MYLYRTARTMEVAQYTAQMYGHNLYGKGRVSGEEFADIIRANYLMSEPMHQVCAECARLRIESISYSPCRLQVTYKTDAV